MGTTPPPGWVPSNEGDVYSKKENMTDFLRSITLLLVLLNPFLVIIYLIDVVEKLDRRQFSRVLIRAGLIATAVFWCFSVLGDAVFSRVMQADFASFQIFGGVVFLLIGLQFVFRGPTAIEILRGESEAKPIAYFTDCDKPMVLNQTNGRVIAKLYGDPMETWSGKRVTLFPTTCEVSGETVPCVRVRPLNPDAQFPVSPIAAAEVNLAAVTGETNPGEVLTGPGNGDIPF